MRPGMTASYVPEYYTLVRLQAEGLLPEELQSLDFNYLLSSKANLTG